jgi:fumarylacetoacetate (FAA) hydrolase
VPRLGVIAGEEVIDVLSARDSGRADLLDPDGIAMIQWITTEPEAKAIINQIVAELLDDKTSEYRYPLSAVKLMPPVAPRSFRDFYAFEEHVRNARKKRGLEMLDEWYEAPVFYFSNTACFRGHGDTIRKPGETNELDYELEIAAVIGKEGSDIAVQDADSYIAGFTVLNDWSARDIQRREMRVGLGPAKGKDFATSLGPYLVTPEDLEDRLVPSQNGKRYYLSMSARVNRIEYSRGNTKDMQWTFAELIAEASRNTTLYPGDVIGSGTVGTGCIVEFPQGMYAWLQPGDEVRLEIEKLGALVNTIV